MTLKDKTYGLNLLAALSHKLLATKIDFPTSFVLVFSFENYATK